MRRSGKARADALLKKHARPSKGLTIPTKPAPANIDEFVEAQRVHERAQKTRREAAERQAKVEHRQRKDRIKVIQEELEKCHEFALGKGNHMRAAPDLSAQLEVIKAHDRNTIRVRNLRNELKRLRR